MLLSYSHLHVYTVYTTIHRQSPCSLTYVHVYTCNSLSIPPTLISKCTILFVISEVHMDIMCIAHYQLKEENMYVYIHVHISVFPTGLISNRVLHE